MGESVDVKALRARFHVKAEATDSSRESNSPKSPLRGLGRGGPLETAVTANGVARHKLSAMFPSPLPGSSSPPDLQRFSKPKRAEPGGAPVPKLPQGAYTRPQPLHLPEPKVSPRPAPPPAVTEAPGKVKSPGETLQNVMLRRPQLPSQKSLTAVTPLRRPLPSEGPRPRKPRRPPHVNLEPYHRTPQAPPTLPERPGLRKADGSSSSGGSSVSLLGLVSPSGPPRPLNKPGSLPRQHASVQVDEEQEDQYDDIDLPPPPPPPPGHPGSCENADSWNDNSSSQPDRWSDESDVYDTIDEDNIEAAAVASAGRPDKRAERERKQRQEQERKDQEKKQKRENEYKRKFKLPGEVEVLYIARVRLDWQGGSKLDLRVRQGESVDILRVSDTPRGKWLARTTNGAYGYISNSCVDVDYEEVKRKHRPSVRPSLPPPPPDPDLESSDHMTSSVTQDEDDYDDVQGLPTDFPPPPPEMSLDPKLEKEFRTKFKFNGPIQVLHSMMVDPNASIKKAGGKDLSVGKGEILDVIQITNDKKALCRNNRGKYGYVSRTLLLQMEGDIYDDVDHFQDIYDNDSVH